MVLPLWGRNHALGHWESMCFAVWRLVAAFGHQETGACNILAQTECRGSNREMRDVGDRTFT